MLFIELKSLSWVVFNYLLLLLFCFVRILFVLVIELLKMYKLQIHI